MFVFLGVMPEFHTEHNLRPRKKRHTSVRKPEGCTAVIHLPKNSNKAFKVSNKVFQDALLKYYGQKRAEEGCNCKEASSESKQKPLHNSGSTPTGSESDSAQSWSR